MGRVSLNQGGILRCLNLVASSFQLCTRDDDFICTRDDDFIFTNTGTDEKTHISSLRSWGTDEKTHISSLRSRLFNNMAKPILRNDFGFEAWKVAPAHNAEIRFGGCHISQGEIDSFPKFGVNDTPPPGPMSSSSKNLNSKIATVGVVAPSKGLYESSVEWDDKKVVRMSDILRQQKNVAGEDPPRETYIQKLLKGLPKVPDSHKPIEQSSEQPKAPSEQMLVNVESPDAVNQQALNKMYMIFSLQLGRGVRDSLGRELWKDQSGKPTPHGLWIGSTDNNYNPTNVQAAFDINQVPDIQSMYSIWPSFFGEENDKKRHEELWKGQWEKHGRGSNMTQTAYMESVVKLTKFFGPIIDEFLIKHTRNLEGDRHYLDVTKFTSDLKIDKGLYVTVHGKTRYFDFKNEIDVEFQELVEVRIYLDGEDPNITLNPETLTDSWGYGPTDSYHPRLEMNII